MSETVLPIESVFSQLTDSLSSHTSVLLQAPPGAGKSTWLPLQLMLSGQFRKIVMLEPRRLAARNIANFLAQQLGEQVGEQIGLRIKQEAKVSHQTRLEIVTEGVLTRMIQQDPELDGIDLIIFDEFHERSLQADTALALSLESQSALRDDLKILVMSATLDSERYQQFLQCPLISSEGRSYPVEEMYVPLRSEREWLAAIPSVIHNAIEEQSGSILVFLPGQKEINFVAQNLGELGDNIDVVSLFGEQNKQQQQAAIAPAPQGRRKVVLTTNVAETSLTIEGVRVVIDCGKKRAAVYNLNTGVSELQTQSISKASAVQRAGRAGRIEPGVVYRLGEKAQFDRRVAHDLPQIKTSDISALMLEAKVWGAEVSALPLLDQPSLSQQEQATQLLQMLEVLDTNGKLTQLGSHIHSFGTEPRHAHMLLKAQQLEVDIPDITALACALVSLWEQGKQHNPDVVIALSAMLSRPTSSFKQAYQHWCKRLKIAKPAELPISAVPLLIALAYPDRIAKRRGQGFLMANGAGVKVNEQVWPVAEYLAIVSLGGEKGMQVFSATPLHIEDLNAYLPYLISQQTVCEFDEKQLKFIHEDRERLGQIILSSKPSRGEIDTQARTQAWLTLIAKQGLSLFKSYGECEQLLTRLELACKFYPDTFRDLSEHALIADLTWLYPYLDQVKQYDALIKLALKDALMSCLEWSQQQALEKLLPVKIQVPSGSNIKLTYQQEGPAKLSVRMQEVFGMLETPRLCEGRLPLLMELLSPAQRPLQLTQDLANFWRTSYKEVQKEMKGRYPKHFWPEDPANSVATSRVKSRM